MLTREQHLDMAKCLKEAKKKLRGEDNRYGARFVCTAIHYTSASVSTKHLLYDWIELQLNEHMTITSWAKNNGANFSKYEQCQEYRHAWVDHMIKVLES